MTTIETVGRSAEDRAIATLTLAFSTDPLMRWIFPDRHQYLTHFPKFAREFGGLAFDHQSAHSADDFNGVALWLPPGVHADEETLTAVFDAGIRPQDKDAIWALLGQTGAYHPGEPHWYLPLIGVDPVWQGRGYGSALLTHALAVCDEQRTVAFLESSNEKNIPLYERHGFVIMDKLQAGDSPPLWPMIREPR